MNGNLALAVLIGALNIGPVCVGEVFADESAMLAITREDQTNAIAIRMLKNELTLSQAIVVLSTYQKVTRDQYMIYAHQPGARGTVTLKDGSVFSWEIEPGYAARVRAGETTIYLLRPGLGSGRAETAQRVPATQPTAPHQ